MTALNAAILAGSLLGLGAALVLWRFSPAHPDLTDALARLTPAHVSRSRNTTNNANTPATVTDRLGLWAMRRIPILGWRTPTKELAILRIPTHRYYGEKVTFALVGLFIPPVLSALAAVANIPLSPAIPLAGSLLLAVALSFLPDYNARTDAAAARVEFSRALTAYIDLVALERNSGAGPRQALEQAARVGDSWVFQRISEELARSRWSGDTPWEAINALAEELGMPELKDLGDIMRLSGDEGTAVYDTLRTRSRSMRAALQSKDLTAANALGERMSIPVAMLVLAFSLILATPAVLNIVTTT